LSVQKVESRRKRRGIKIKMQYAYGKKQNNPPTLISYFVVYQTAL
jgi:hypothetical protein